MPQISHPFAPPLTVDARGLVATTQDLDPALLIAGYFLGLFPWTDDPVGWFCPAERGILLPHEAHFPRNLPRLMRKAGFCVTCDTAFEQVITRCQEHHRSEGEWITPRFVRAYTDLFRLGHAHSIEVWQEKQLVGGLYGVQTGQIFSAESMFSAVSNASKAAVYFLVHAAKDFDVALIDVQVLGETTHRLGGRSIPREIFLQLLHTFRPQAPPPSPKSWPKDRTFVPPGPQVP